MISIIIPVYNQADKLISTLKSLVLQTINDYEVIIVDDGSTDQVVEKFTAYSKTIISSNKYLFISQGHAGAPAARNHGLKEAKGDYLFFCDADAVLQPEALETMINTLNIQSTASYAYSSFLWGRKLFKVGAFDPEKLKKTPYINTMALIRRADFPEVGWDESLKKFQDWDLWLTMLERGKVGVWVPQVLFKIAPGGQISSWLPSFIYKLFPFLKTVKKYQQALKIIKDKHGLS